ncbi:Acetophenone carboxylase gamma subunit [Pseudomonas syringae pv. actinidiae]|uniref:hydantoinase/oxoprolinase family protein n=1 Tax=Pseudomonas syringae TaxID=317 RepID=UPI000A21E8C2|nr:hydantoinase/oxoprolinase family protein [Pseudomonas syringae]OSR68736.1 Acetophenone carboxylase gamma subunit [Pseudomonas syringae pv. actinidiae]
MTYQIAVDVGGTFTDLVLRDEAGHVELFKSLTTPGKLSQGIINGLKLIAARQGVALEALLGNCEAFACGTTAATNAILESKTARTVLLCTEGFRDVLSIREGGRRNGFSITEDFPDPYVPRELTLAIKERINAEGGVEIPIDLVQARSVLEDTKALQPQAIAVALLWSITNPDHEKALAGLIEEILPGVPYSLSHEVNPVIGEYRRTSATCIDASLKPVLRKQISNLEEVLRANGFTGMPTFVCSNGGRTSSAEITHKPVYLCLSGPSTAPAAAVRLAREAGVEGGNIITIDLGGTSLDASIARAGKVAMHREGAIAGHVFGVPSVDVVTVGAGGGSIAWVDAGNLLHVGPESAGSNPGPACYGRGGTKPTLTDANLVRGLLDGETFADGQFKLSKDRAVQAIQEHVATPLNISVEQAASLIALVCEQNMVAAIEDLAMRRGYDPREFLLVSGGAAGGLHAACLARDLGMKQLLVPRVSCVLCAYGTATGLIKFDFSKSHYTSSASFDVAGVADVLSLLADEGWAFLDRMHIPQAQRELLFSVEARYQGQVSLLSVMLSQEDVTQPKFVESLVSAFHATHEQLYSVHSPDDAVEFVAWSVEAIGKPEHVEQVAMPAKALKAAQAVGHRLAHIDASGAAKKVLRYAGAELTPGDTLEGQSVVEDRLTTVFIPEHCTALVTQEGGLLIDISKE